jgi:hypothetical protein
MSIYGVKTLKNKLKELGPYLGVKIGSFLLHLSPFIKFEKQTYLLKYKT